MLKDNNHQTHFTLDSFNTVKCTPTAFAGGTANAHGDSAGTGNPLTLFTVTGDVLVRIFGVCTTSLESAGGGTLEVGVTGNTAALITQTTGTDIDANKIWNDASPAVGTDTLANVTGPHVIVNGMDIIETVGTADITAGAIYYICLWRPLSHNGNVISAI